MSTRPSDTPLRTADVQDGDTVPVVRFEGVSMRYGRGPETLSDLRFTLHPGSFHFLTGPSGAGKSSLLKLIYLAHRASRGRVELFGRDISLTRPEDLPFVRRRIGVVFQDFRLLDHLPVFDNAALPLRIAGRKPASYRDDVAELLQWVGLGERMHALPATLSGGEKQRLAIARAVVDRPDVLLADEPTGNVDPAMSLRLLRLFVELNRLGTTVLIATHDEDLVARANRPTLHLENGRLVDVADASPEPDYDRGYDDEDDAEDEA
ncbi:cell division ATP-binding protein FtsE [Caulobacter sp. Root1472]|uniref:cell division ATP-binding protein FtsE n=1 Tax=Caulobacter sp. Root1472 TaxID=1736470 RepID=UPI0009EC917E|nr:cell division ATP-binding protein FtsE [Caulobacter sp. Root1472]